MRDFATKQDFSDTQKVIKSFVRIEVINDFKDEVMPVVQTGARRIEQYKVDNQQMREAIREFDRVLCEKANKMGITELQSYVDKNYVKNKSWTAMQGQFTEVKSNNQAEINKMTTTLKSFERGLGNEIEKVTNKVIADRMQ